MTEKSESFAYKAYKRLVAFLALLSVINFFSAFEDFSIGIGLMQWCGAWVQYAANSVFWFIKLEVHPIVSSGWSLCILFGGLAIRDFAQEVYGNLNTNSVSEFIASLWEEQKENNFFALNLQNSGKYLFYLVFNILFLSLYIPIVDVLLSSFESGSSKLIVLAIFFGLCYATHKGLSNEKTDDSLPRLLGFLFILFVVVLIVSPLILLYFIIAACFSRIRVVLVYAIAMVAIVYVGQAVEPLTSDEAKAKVSSLPQAPEPEGTAVAPPLANFVYLFGLIEFPCGNNALGLCENGVQQIEIND